MTTDELRRLAAEGRRIVVAIRWEPRDADTYPFVELPIETLEVLADLADECAYRGGADELLKRLDDLESERWA